MWKARRGFFMYFKIIMDRLKQAVEDFKLGKKRENIVLILFTENLLFLSF